MFGFRHNCPTTSNITNPFLFFGSKDEIQEFVKNQNFIDIAEDTDGLFVPLDGSVPGKNLEATTKVFY